MSLLLEDTDLNRNLSLSCFFFYSCRVVDNFEIVEMALKHLNKILENPGISTMHFLLQTSCSYIYSGDKKCAQSSFAFLRESFFLFRIYVCRLCALVFALGIYEVIKDLYPRNAQLFFMNWGKDCRNGQFFHAIQKFYSPIKTYPAIKHHFLPVKA